MNFKAGCGAPLKPAGALPCGAPGLPIHTKLLITSRHHGVASPAIALGSPVRCGGGSGGGIRARIRGDVENGAGRDRRHYVRRNDVPMADQTLANQVLGGRIRGRDPLPRMSRMSGVRSAPHGRPIAREVQCGLSSTSRAGRYPRRRCRIAPCSPLQTTLRRAHLGAARSARLDLSQTSSQARARARAWDVAARCGKLGDNQQIAGPPPSAAEKARPEAPHRATTPQSRAARMARADSRTYRCARDLRRAAKSMVRAGVAAG